MVFGRPEVVFHRLVSVCLRRSKLKIEPINGFQLVIEPEVPKQPLVCCHEDGGYKAIFEQVTNPAELHQVWMALIVFNWSMYQR